MDHRVCLEGVTKKKESLILPGIELQSSSYPAFINNSYDFLVI
jgi:hypothetical protein